MSAATIAQCRDDLAAAFACRAATLGVVERHILVAGTPVTFRFAGEDLVGFFTAAYAHLPRHDGTSPDRLVVHVWGADPDAPLPRLPSEAFPDGPAEHRRMLSGDPTIAYEWQSRTLELHDVAGAVAWSCTADVERLPWWVRAAPAKTAIGRHLAEHGISLLHSAAVARDGAAVLLTGPSGSGKSTTSLRCLVAGAGFLGDDYCVATPDGRVHSVLGSAKAHLHNLDGFEALVADATPTTGREDPDEKMIMWPARTWPDRVVASAEIVGIVALTVSDGTTTEVAGTSAGHALRALAPSTVIQLPGIGERSMAAMARLAGAVPCWSVTLGSDRAGVVAAVDEVIARGRT